MNKRGLSTIVITLIIILISLVAVGIIWVVVRNVIQTGTKEVTIGQFTLDAKIKDVNVFNSSNNVSLILKRNPGVGEFSKMNFVFYDGKSSEVITQPVSLNELEEKWFMFHLGTINVSNLISISIFPYVKQDEKEILGNILDKYTVGSGSSTIILPVCTPATCASLGYECGTNWANGTNCAGTLNCEPPNCTVRYGSGYICNFAGRCIFGTCAPDTCAAHGYECGNTWLNGSCSGNLNCGTCGSQATCPSGTCVCNSGWADCNNDNTCECDLSSNSCSGGSCVVNPVGNIIYALSCNYNDVNTSVNNANPGDTVIVPAGNCTWSTQLLINKGIIFRGAGIDQTIINNGIINPLYISTSHLIIYDPSDYSRNDPFRMTGFTFNADGRRILGLGAAAKTAPFTVQTQVRIDHNRFVNNVNQDKGQAIWNYCDSYGVVDNNLFDNFGYPIAHSLASDDDTWWANSPQNIFQHGSPYYMYFEDNVFRLVNLSGSDNLLTDGEYGVRYVFRYNTILFVVRAASYSLFEMHGEQVPQMPASFGAELYGNHVVYNHTNNMGFWKQRSGQSLVFLNNAIASTNPFNNAYTSSACDCPPNYPELKVTHNSYWWGNRRNYTAGFWSASADGGLGNATVPCNGLIDIPTLGRDVFSDTSSPGVSSGTLANLPVTCTVGQGYWATTQSTTNLTGMVGKDPSTPISGTLYRCTATNTWTAYYTPYIYPHPLRSILD